MSLYETNITNFEKSYLKMLHQVNIWGVEKQTRNAKTKSTFGMTLKITPDEDEIKDRLFPILVGRKMYPKGVLGEFAAMLRGPKSVEDFEKFGCNYWKQWANEDGSLNVDYGNAWIDWNGVNQVEQLVRTLKKNPNDRRMIVSGWRPDLIPYQSLPCCHMLYQWYVENNKLHMIWYQRSVDMMVGLPSDIILAAIWNIMLANEVGMEPASLTFMLGDCHIYGQHYDALQKYSAAFETVRSTNFYPQPSYDLTVAKGKPLLEFLPQDIRINFTAGPKIDLEVLA